MTGCRARDRSIHPGGSRASLRCRTLAAPTHRAIGSILATNADAMPCAWMLHFRSAAEPGGRAVWRLDHNTSRRPQLVFGTLGTNTASGLQGRGRKWGRNNQPTDGQVSNRLRIGFFAGGRRGGARLRPRRFACPSPACRFENSMRYRLDLSSEKPGEASGLVLRRPLRASEKGHAACTPFLHPPPREVAVHGMGLGRGRRLSGRRLEAQEEEWHGNLPV